jgi:beta-lactamase regulating signal transducer with metallopeptidase domain
LLPFSLFESPVSVMNALPYQPSYSTNVVQTTAPAPVGSGNEVLPDDLQINQTNNNITHKTDYRTVVVYLWLCGILVSGTIFLIANVRLSRKLKQSRKQVGTPDCSLPVYTAEGLPSPCLYGLWKPSIYLTAESLASEQRLALVITHELTHYRHGDHIWSFVRAFCVCVHWFNPLVWLAAILSRRDSEIACDEGTLRRLGDESRSAYGKTLIEMMTMPSKPTDLFRCATTMTGGKGEITERIKRIAQKPKMLLVTLVAVLLIAVVAVMSAFGGVASVTLMEAAGGFTLEILDSVEYGTLISDNKIMDIPTAKAEEITGFIKELRVSKKEVTKVRKNDRDSTNQIHLVYSGFASGEPRNIYFNFNRDFSQVWVNNEVKPSLSYAVKKPNEVKAFFDRQFGSTTTPIEIGSAEELWKARTQYIGDNSAVGKLIGLLPAPEDVRYDHFELHTSEQPYDIEIVYSASSDVLKQYDTEEARKSNPFRKNALILLALVDNAKGVRAVLTDGEREVGFINAREWADYTVGEDVRNYAESPEKLQELIAFPITEATSAQYSFAKLGKNGEVISGYSLQNQQLAEAIIMDSLIKSSVWYGVDITTLEESYLIRQTFQGSGETHDYYAYLLDDGTAVLQRGAKGMYSVLSQELYSELAESFENLIMDTWPENQYTEGVPKPDFGTMLWMRSDEEQGYCAVAFQQVSKEQIELYIQALMDYGWHTIHDFYENTTIGGLYEKGTHAISLQFAGNQFVMYLSLK